MKYNEDGSLVLTGKLGDAVAWGDLWEFNAAVERGSDPDLTYQDMADFAEFSSQFKILGGFLSDPGEDFYQGQSMVTVIQRADGATFGKFYWQGGGKYGESNMEADDFTGEDGETDVWVFKPVQPFTITGYKEAD